MIRSYDDLIRAADAYANSRTLLTGIEPDVFTQRVAQEEPVRLAPGKDNSWILYILRCNDGSFYTGITNDLARRFNQHQAGRASRYTRSRRPVRMVYGELCASRSHALRRESAVKALSRKEKEDLIHLRRFDMKQIKNKRRV